MAAVFMERFTSMDVSIALLVLVRIGTAVGIASLPAMVQSVPWRMRIGFTTIFAFLLVPFVPHSVNERVLVDGLPAGWLPAGFGELLCGAMIGFGIRIWFTGAGVCGQLIGQSSGLGMITLGRGGVGALKSYFQWLWVAVFMVAGGMQHSVTKLLDSFQLCPVGSFVFDDQTVLSIAKTLTLAFSYGLSAGFPIIAAMLLVMLVSSLLGRLVPQVHVLTTSTGISALMLVALLWIGSGPLLRCLEIQVPRFTTIGSALAEKN